MRDSSEPLPMYYLPVYLREDKDDEDKDNEI